MPGQAPSQSCRILREQESDATQPGPGRMALGGQQGQRGWTCVSRGIMAGSIVSLIREKGRTFSYMAEEIGACRQVIGRD
jgi:hypothetical protein